MANSDLDYHRDRARAELDCAYRASHGAAVKAHLRLAALHMHKLAGQDGSPTPEPQSDRRASAV